MYFTSSPQSLLASQPNETSFFSTPDIVVPELPPGEGSDLSSDAACSDGLLPRPDTLKLSEALLPTPNMQVVTSRFVSALFDRVLNGKLYRH